MPGLTASTVTGDGQRDALTLVEGDGRGRALQRVQLHRCRRRAQLVTEPVELWINAAATDAVDTAMIALRPATKIFLECRSRPNRRVDGSRTSESLRFMSTPL